MSSTNIEQVMPVKLAQALANPLFPALDSALRSGRHIGLDELDNHAFLMDFQEYLEEFYARYMSSNAQQMPPKRAVMNFTGTVMSMRH